MSPEQLELSVLGIGAEFAGYRVEAVLGRQSGVGRVYEATSLKSGDRVALKVFKGRELEDPARRTQFTRSVEAQARLSHPNVVPIHEWGTEPTPYIVMGLVLGTTLAGLLSGGTPRGLPTLEILGAVAAGLDAGQRQGLVYRRLQPSGILVDYDGTVQLGDFGAGRGARAMEMLGRGRLGRYADYISPEEVDDGEATAASGIYSLGAMAFETLTGHAPFASEHEGVTLRAHLEAAPTAPGAERPGLPPRLDQAILRALSKDPSLRQRSSGELMETVIEAFPEAPDQPEQAPVTVPAPERSRRRPRPVVALLAAAGVAAAAALGAVAAGGDEPPSSPEPAKRVSTKHVTVSHPASWRVARQAPELAGLRLADPLALSPPAGGTELVAGRVSGGSLGSTGGQLVDLGGVIGRRYPSLREAGSGRRAVAYAVPAAGGTVVAACFGPASGAGRAACERVASTVRPRREGAALAVASPSYARALNGVVRRLERVRVKGRRRLARARTPAGQRRITARLSRDYATLAGALARIDAPAPARASQRVAVSQLRRASRGFRDMSRAARARSGRRWVAARAGVRSAEGRVQGALVSLRRRGYQVR